MSKESFSIALIDADLLCNKKQRFPNSELENFFNLKKENSEKFLKILENT